MIKLSYNDREIEITLDQYLMIMKSIVKHERVLQSIYDNVTTRAAEIALTDENEATRGLYNKLDELLSEKELPF